MSNLWIAFAVGITTRIILFMYPEVIALLSNRIEVTTPATSWKKVTEGLQLFNTTGLLHNGDAYHGSTLLLTLAGFLRSFPLFIENLFFIFCDVVTAVALYKFAQKYLLSEFTSQNKKSSYSSDVSLILLKSSHVKYAPMLISISYILHPFAITACAVKSTLTITNMFIALFLYEMLCANVIFSTLFLAVSTYESFYTGQLLLAAMLAHYKYGNKRLSFWALSVLTLCGFSFWFILLLTIAYLHEKSFFMIFDHFYFILTVPDQTPNIGIFWYFFTEIFDHFQHFFLFVFQFHVVVFSFPMCFKLKFEPVLLAFATIGILSIFKSYPAFGDASLWLSLLPLWSHTFKYLRFHVIGPVMIVTAIILCPIMWNLWIYAQSANANFFFAATLVYNTAQVFILADIVRSYLEWHVHLRKGLNLKMPNSDEDARLRLLD